MNAYIKFAVGLACGLLAGAAFAQAPKAANGGYSIFDGTMVDLNYQQVEGAAKRGAILLWPLGVIEEHAPHLPLGTDIYNSTAAMKEAARQLRAKGREVLVAPPMYWGINDATGAFGGSFSVKPSTLKAIIEDTFASFKKDGFQAVYLITGHGDRLHNITIVEGVEAARSSTGMRGFVVLPPILRDRLGLKGTEAHILVTDAAQSAFQPAAKPSPYVEVHAGMSETSIFWHNYPALVDTATIPKLADTKFTIDDLNEWRKGWDNARAKTPLGYLGDPASSDPKKGEELFTGYATGLANAILKHMGASPWIRQGR
jgi:creatinine amidohydrolase